MVTVWAAPVMTATAFATPAPGSKSVTLAVKSEFAFRVLVFVLVTGVNTPVAFFTMTSLLPPFPLVDQLILMEVVWLAPETGSKDIPETWVVGTCPRAFHERIDNEIKRVKILFIVVV